MHIHLKYLYLEMQACLLRALNMHLNVKLKWAVHNAMQPLKPLRALVGNAENC